ncbi:MAG: ROK family protein [Phycisphaerales bacterium]|nr:ROK family protein [Phycisphaerales bacterium]
MSSSLAIGVDLGATKIASALVTRDGKVLTSRQCETRVDQGPAAVFDRIAAEANALRATTPPPHEKILGVGIGSPGIIDSARGIVQGAVNLQWKNVPLADEVASRLHDLPVVVENDANVNAVGEGYFGSAVGSRDYILLTVGSGLGSGIVAGGKLITGAHSFTDLGHYSLDPDHGLMCRCGHRGCAETVCSGPGLVNAARDILAQKSLRSVLSDTPDLASAQILQAARAQDSVACAAISRLAKWLGHIAAAAAAVIDPDVIVIGGGLGVAIVDLIQDDMSREFLRRVPRCFVPPTIRPATLPSPAMGAATIVWSRGVHTHALQTT